MYIITYVFYFYIFKFDIMLCLAFIKLVFKCCQNENLSLNNSITKVVTDIVTDAEIVKFVLHCKYYASITVVLKRRISGSIYGTPLPFPPNQMQKFLI